MKIDEAVSILRAHNKWRRAPAHLPEDARPAMGDPRKIGIAIDTVCDVLADARLIAAAPDLLEALQSVWLWMENQADAQSKGGHATFDLMALREQRDIASAAIAKATAAEGGE